MRKQVEIEGEIYWRCVLCFVWKPETDFPANDSPDTVETDEDRVCSDCSSDRLVSELVPTAEQPWRYLDYYNRKSSATVRRELFLAQDGRCAICGVPESETGNNRRLALDHDHETDFIRGLLCTKCNMLLGIADDNLDILRAALHYLEDH